MECNENKIKFYLVSMLGRFEMRGHVRIARYFGS